MNESLSPEAMYHQGVLAIEAGDRETARSWYMRAAEYDFPDALSVLGEMSMNDGDPSKARAWWIRAAKHHHTNAMCHLGWLASQEGDQEAEAAWYRRAADEGHAGAMRNLGNRANSEGDLGTAHDWLLRAAAAGDGGAMHNLGVMAYQAGDLASAHSWIRSAAATGEKASLSNLDEFAGTSVYPEMADGTLSPEMSIARLQRLVQQSEDALAANQFLDAEDLLERAANLSAFMAGFYGDSESLLSYGICLENLSVVLTQMGAEPEAEDPLVQATNVFRSLKPRRPSESVPALARALIALAKVYRNGEGYLARTGSVIKGKGPMRDYRRKGFANGTWFGPRVSFVSDDWSAKAEAPLVEAIALLRQLMADQQLPNAGGDPARYEPSLAIALNLLGETYVNTDRAGEAESPLLEAEALYDLLVRQDPERFQHLLTDTRELLARAAQERG